MKALEFADTSRLFAVDDIGYSFASVGGALIVMVRSIDVYLYDRSLPCMSRAALKHIAKRKQL